MKLFSHKICSIFFIVLLIIVIIIDVFYKVNLYIYISFFISISLIYFWASYSIKSGFYLKSITKTDKQNSIIITFDDGPDTENTPKILDILEKYNAKAIFFVIGKKIAGNEDILLKIIEKGHKIGNHSYTHSVAFDFFSTKKVESDILKTNKKIENLTAEKNLLFRPPFGVTNPNIARAVNNLEMSSIGWSIRSLDTAKNKTTVLKRISGVKQGDIILFHDNINHTPEILDKFLRLCNNKGLKTTLI